MMGAAVAMNMRGGRDLLSFLDFQGPRQLLSLIAVNSSSAGCCRWSATPRTSVPADRFPADVLRLRPWPRPGHGVHAGAAGRRRALFVSLCCWCLWPVTRWDWLLRAATTTAEPARQQLLFEAAQRSGLPAPARPDPDQGTEPDPPRRGR